MRLAQSACRRATPTYTSSLPLYLRRQPFSASTAHDTPSSARDAAQPSTALPPPPPARWITDLRARVGKCLVFGCNDAQIAQAAAVLRAIATEWRELLAGSEGYLTGGRRGLDAREVVWGEMDSFVGGPPI